MKKFAILFFAFTLCITACKDETPVITTPVDDRPEILSYIETNNLTATETDLGVFLVEEIGGAGDMPTAANSVRVRYVGSYLTDGQIFDQTQGNDTATFPMTGVITGFRDGLENMRVGGKTKIIIPSALGYGPRPTNGIRDNAILIFDTELVEIL